ncbi:predicted protein [Sclerotinia sclerotiorum 1980 UF-70]|uniref:Uncharacterized protein n=1 Tax=Sclerotinia sclerotiorum (strain ATCC 18683 / 1980 / Ss-1) TaxID=665079 RepID=A7EGM7_SCLS1|nr:predicted protein [Sclerotinia sclerotiorum 1980 UF-70]EDO01993.1 predicted protein [Sclerotinia sclerotiorum 1980 UF-70]
MAGGNPIKACLCYRKRRERLDGFHLDRYNHNHDNPFK